MDVRVLWRPPDFAKDDVFLQLWAKEVLHLLGCEIVMIAKLREDLCFFAPAFFLLVPILGRMLFDFEAFLLPHRVIYCAHGVLALIHKINGSLLIPR
jgi:hypothetical protein